MDAEAEEEPSPEPEPEGEQTESDLTNSENEVLIVVSFQVFFFYVFEGSMPTDGWQRHPHANADERVIFWRSGAKRFLDFFLASRYPCELGITSGSMEDNEFLATMKAILTSCLGWQRVDETRVEEVQALEDGHGRRILMFGRDCIEDRSRGSRKNVELILEKMPQHTEKSVVIVERMNHYLDSEPNTLLVTPFIEDVYREWPWEVRNFHDQSEVERLQSFFDAFLFQDAQDPSFDVRSLIRRYHSEIV